MTGRELFNEGKTEAGMIAARPPLPANPRRSVICGWRMCDARTIT
jgi:hypothetical protein